LMETPTPRRSTTRSGDIGAARPGCELVGLADAACVSAGGATAGRADGGCVGCAPARRLDYYDRSSDRGAVRSAEASATKIEHSLNSKHDLCVPEILLLL
jgi:hypothetical protein